MSRESGYIDGRQTDTYRIWAGMKNRCENPKNKDFGRYGGRGISVCERWQTFSNFLFDMGERPDGLTIERVKNEKGYDPENCIWATRKVQRRNTSLTVRVVLDGKNISLVEACEVLGVKYQNARMRIRRGWSVSRSLETERATANC
jgi:hypothetical protein